MYLKIKKKNMITITAGRFLIAFRLEYDDDLSHRTKKGITHYTFLGQNVIYFRSRDERENGG